MYVVGEEAREWANYVVAQQSRQPVGTEVAQMFATAAKKRRFLDCQPCDGKFRSFLKQKGLSRV